MTDKMFEAIGRFANRRQFLQRLTRGSAALVATGLNWPSRVLGSNDGVVLATAQGDPLSRNPSSLAGNLSRMFRARGSSKLLVQAGELTAAGEASKAVGVDAYRVAFTVDPAEGNYRSIDAELLTQSGTVVGKYGERRIRSSESVTLSESFKLRGKSLFWSFQLPENRFTVNIDGKSLVSSIGEAPSPQAGQLLNEHKDLLILSSGVQADIRRFVQTALFPFQSMQHDGRSLRDALRGGEVPHRESEASDYCPPVCNGQEHEEKSPFNLGLTRTAACQHAHDAANLACWNALCTGCCEWLSVGNGNCDCICFPNFGDFLCVCNATGRSCSPGDCPPPPPDPPPPSDPPPDPPPPPEGCDGWPGCSCEGDWDCWNCEDGFCDQWGYCENGS